MDDSDQDFAELYSKPLKRVRKKAAESRPTRPCSQEGEGDKRRRNNRRNGDDGCKATGSQPVCTGASQQMVNGGTVHSDAGLSAVLSAAAGTGPGPGPRAERGLRAKDKVLNRMQQFKRASPQRMVHRSNSQPAEHEDHCGPLLQPQRQDPPEPCTSGLHLDSDEALALRLQQELDREAGETERVDLEDGGLFFCQICHKDMSHMTPEGRTQHLNRCLDESEESAPAPPPPPPPGVPDCPICGKRFKSQKSRSAHLKRCSSDMGVPPAVLLQVLQRQAEEIQTVPTGNTLAQTGGIKRKGASKPGNPAKRKPRKKTDPMDEDTMVALALSSSLLEQEKEIKVQPGPAAPLLSLIPTIKWRTDAGTGRGKKKKGAVPRPPPLLLVQDAQEALMRLQERVSALLLRSRAPSPPTPTRCPSGLRGWSGAAPLWQKSTLLNASSTCLSDFYTPELKEFITPWESATTNAASSNAGSKPDSSLQPGIPVTETGASVLSSSSQTAAVPSAPSTPGTGPAPVGSQALRDLMELAEDGLTLTQCGYSTSGTDNNKQSGACLSTNLHLSGFVPEEAEEQADLCVSGFLPETAHTLSVGTHRKTDQPRADEERGSHRSVALSRLASDLSSMVNNPQLSDLQLQVDTGEVYFAHSFMVYARCPLLAEMVHESGFRVQEVDMPAAQRVLMSDVPGQAVFTLLQYLYTAQCSIPASLQPHVLELASRFDLQELQQLCELHQEETDHMNQDENVSDQTDQAFVELLRSMWNEEDEDDGGVDTDGGNGEEEGRLEEDRKISDVTTGEREICEERVNEEELEEIYEFAATQRKREEEKDSVEEEEKEQEEEVFTKPTEPTRGLSEKLNAQPEPDLSLDRSYSRLFSHSWGVYEEEDPPASPSNSSPQKTHTPQSQKHQSPHKPSLELSGRTLLLSSPSVVDDLSTSPPPCTSNLPIAGLSPGLVGDCGGGGDNGPDAVKLDKPEECLSFNRESQGPSGVRFPVSPSPVKKEEPELIVLSDSSEEMEVDLAVLKSCSPPPPSPCAIQDLQRFTRITPQSIPKATPDQSPVECSPEVSWLIPSTPMHRTMSTQTKSSICRTRLFPKGDISSSLSSSSPVPSLHNQPETLTRVSAHADLTERGVPGLKLEESVPCSSSSELGSPPKRIASYDASKNRDVFAVPQNQHKPSHRSNSTHHRSLEASLKQDTPLHLQHVHPQPCSSTPLHMELHQVLVPLADSPVVHSEHDQQRWTSQERDRSPSESPQDKTELASFHLSPLSDRLDPPSSSSHRGLQSSQRDGKSSSESRRSVEYSDHSNTGAELKRSSARNEEGERETECGSTDMCYEEEQEEEKGGKDVAEHSLLQSFMDEPPIAFSDSWEACIGGNPGCFSLRLEDSGGSNQLERSEVSRSLSSAERPPPPPSGGIQQMNSSSIATKSSPVKARSTQPSTSVQAPTPPAPDHNSLLESRLWDSWEEEEEEVLPLSQRVNPSAQLKTPKSSYINKRRSLVPITPMPQYSDMDTPELKNKLNRFGVRPLPKRQMILKLREIHQYTHQLVSSSDSEDEAPSADRAAQMKPPAAGSRPVSCAQTVRFKEPRAPAAISPLKHKGKEEEEGELLSASQGSNTSSTAASEESERSNPELCLSSDGNSDSDGGISASQAANRLQDRLQAVRSFILSDPTLYNQILQYKPLVLSKLQERLKAAGIRLGAAKLMDYLDSQCITFTTAKPGHTAPSRRRGNRTGRGAKAAGEKRAYKKKAVTVTL